MITYKIKKRYTMLHTCCNCNYLYIKAHGNQKYCDDCKEDVKKEQANKRKIKYRFRWNKVLKRYRHEAIAEAYKEHGSLMETQYIGKGTGSLGAHRNEDFTKEHSLILKEMQRLKIL